MSTTQEKIAVMQAFVEGKEIQQRPWRLRIGAAPADDKIWEDSLFPSWNWSIIEYRIKPEPQKLFVIYNGGGGILRFFSDEVSAARKLQYFQESGVSGPYIMKEFIEVM